MNARPTNLLQQLGTKTPWIASLLAFGVVTMLQLAACPSQDETRKPDGPGPADDETGQHAPPAPEPGPECARPPCAE